MNTISRIIAQASEYVSRSSIRQWPGYERFSRILGQWKTQAESSKLNQNPKKIEYSLPDEMFKNPTARPGDGELIRWNLNWEKILTDEEREKTKKIIHNEHFTIPFIDGPFARMNKKNKK